MRITFGMKISSSCLVAAVIAFMLSNWLGSYQIDASLIFVVVGLVGLGIGLLVSWHFQANLNKFGQILDGLAKSRLNGDENYIFTQDEFGQFLHQIVDWNRQQKSTISRVHTTSENLTHLIQKIFLRIVETFKNLESQNTSLQRAVNKIVEMNTILLNLQEKAKDLTDSVTNTTNDVNVLSSNISEESSKVDSATNISQEAVNAAREGTGVIREMEEGMTKIADHVKSASQTIDKLGKSSDEIEEIISVIDDIADQTNLLALNAAIEAARAGEQGRGFAVVAESVRNLAEKTQKATKEIVVMIKNLQDETSGAVHSMEGGTKEVETGVGMAAKAGQTLERIVGSIEKVNDLVTEIREHATEQTQIKHKIATMSAGIDRITQSLFSSMATHKQSAFELKQEIENLEQLSNKIQQVLAEIRRDTEEVSNYSVQLKSWGIIQDKSKNSA